MAGFCLRAGDLPASLGEDEFKRLLKDRYDQKTLIVAVSGLHCGEYVHAVPTLNYFHYAGGVAIPNSRQSMEQFDERTLRGKPTTLNVTKVEKGEPVKVAKFYVRSDNVEFILSPTDLGRLQNLDTRKASSTTTSTALGRSTVVAAPAFRFFFYFDKATTLAQGNAKDVAAEIEKYFTSKEAMQKLDAAERNVEINPGMTLEEVTKKLGQPLKSIRVGSQTLLKFSDFTIVMNDGRVAEVKIN